MISLEIPEAIVAEVDGVPVFECRYGIKNGQYALRVNKILGTDQFGGSGDDGG